MLSLNPLFEREWRERFRRRETYWQLGVFLAALGALLCFGVWRASLETPSNPLAWRAQGRMFLDWYRVTAGMLFWPAALLLGSVSVSDEKIGATWEHLLLCEVGGRGLAVGKIASSAAYLVILQFALLPLLLVAGGCFGVATGEIAGVMMSHLLLTVQGATLGLWGAIRAQTLGEGLLESLAAIGRFIGQTVVLLIGASWCVVLLGSVLSAVMVLAPSPVAAVFKWLLAAFIGALLWAAKALVSFVAGMTGLGVLAQSVAQVKFALLPLFLWAGQLVGVALFLKWSAWEVDYPAREFWGLATDALASAKSSLVTPPPVSAPVRLFERVPSPFEAHNANKTTAPPLFGKALAPANILRDAPSLFDSLDANKNSPLGTSLPPVNIPRAASPVSRAIEPQPIQNEPRHAEENVFTPTPTRGRVLYRAWSWALSPSQLAAFPIKEARDLSAKNSTMLPTWEQQFALEPSSTDQLDEVATKTIKRMRAPVSRRFQEWNPVLWLDLTRCLSLRSPDSKMFPVLLTIGALGGSFVLAVGLFLLVSWVQNVFGGARGDVSSFVSTWNSLHWILWWGALGFGPLWGATGFVVERRTGMLVELRLTLLTARAVWWGKFAARFGIVAALSLPILALVAFFAWNWPDKNGLTETISALVSSWALATWSLLACLWISDSCRRELAAGLWCGAFGIAWGVLLWNFPTFFWTPIHILGATLAGGHLLFRLKRLGFG